jgi:hypothetical protein
MLSGTCGAGSHCIVKAEHYKCRSVDDATDDVRVSHGVNYAPAIDVDNVEGVQSSPG